MVEASRRYDDICVPGDTVEDREAFLYQVFHQAHMRTAYFPSMLVVRSISAFVAMASKIADTGRKRRSAKSQTERRMSSL